MEIRSKRIVMKKREAAPLIEQDELDHKICYSKLWIWTKISQMHLMQPKQN